MYSMQRRINLSCLNNRLQEVSGSRDKSSGTTHDVLSSSVGSGQNWVPGLGGGAWLDWRGWSVWLAWPRILGAAGWHSTASWLAARSDPLCDGGGITSLGVGNNWSIQLLGDGLIRVRQGLGWREISSILVLRLWMTYCR